MLANLVTLDLGDCGGVYGPKPVELWTLQKLESLDFGAAGLSGYDHFVL